MRKLLAGSLLVCLLSAQGCSDVGTRSTAESGRAPEGTEFADWTVPVPDDATVHGYLPVPPDERTETLAFERELEVTGAYDAPFYEPEALDVDAAGSIWVLDGGNHRVVVFDETGEPLRAFGREGEGPGEFQEPRSLAVVDGRVVIHDLFSSRWSVFDTEGSALADHNLQERVSLVEMLAVDDTILAVDAELVGLRPGVDEQPAADWRIARRALDGSIEATLLTLADPTRTYWRKGRTVGSVPLRVARPVGAITDGGSIYATAGDEYQVLAMDPSGAVRWALRAALDPPAPDPETKERIVQRWREQLPELGLSGADFVWPDRLAAIENLEVDASGNLYVFPHAERTLATWIETEEPVPVDVYSPAGDRLLAGWSPIEGWDAALGPFVYRIETDPATEERVVARYRIRDDLR